MVIVEERDGKTKYGIKDNDGINVLMNELIKIMTV